MRIEFGPKDFENKTYRIVKRNNGKKKDVSWMAIIDEVEHTLEEIQLEMYVTAVKKLDSKRATALNWEEFMA